MTIALALILLGALMLYCGIGGHSLRHALLGQKVAGGQGSLVK